MELIKVGSKGPEVKKIQEKLGLEADGIFGKNTEKAVKKFQNDNGLKADGVVGQQTWDTMFSSTNKLNLSSLGESFEYKPINVHITKCSKRVPKYLVIHYTAGSSSKKGSAMNNRNVFLKRNASADFVVDDGSIIQVNPDPQNYYCWAVGDGNGKRGIYNKDCVNIEICSNLTRGTTAKVPNHEGWYFTEESLHNAIELSKLLMKAYNIPLKNVIRHYDATGKLCPGIIGWNDDIIYDKLQGVSTKRKNNSSEWNKFKGHLQ